MEGHATTLNELRARQLESHPEWELDKDDLVYVEHGTGSDRNRIFTIQDIYTGSREIEYLHDTTDGTTHSITSEDIVNAYKKGKLPIVWIGGGTSSSQTRVYFFPRRISYSDDVSVQENRKCEFFAYVTDSNDHNILRLARYYNIAAQGQGEGYASDDIDLTYPDSLQTRTFYISDSVRLTTASVSPTESGLSIAQKSGDTWNNVVDIVRDGSGLARMRFPSWEVGSGDNGGFVIKNSSITPVAISSSGNVTLSETLTVQKDLLVQGDLKPQGNFLLPKMIYLSSGGLDLTQGDYANDTKYPVNSVICVWCSDQVTHTIKTTGSAQGGSYTLPQLGCMLFVKTQVDSSSPSYWRPISPGV